MVSDDFDHPLDKIFMPWLYAILALEMVVVVALLVHWSYLAYKWILIVHCNA